MTNSIAPMVKELHRAYDKALALFPEDAREKMEEHKPVLLIQRKGRRNVLGYHFKDRWKNGEKERVTEISISAEHLKDGIHGVVGTLVHEMVHHANALRGIRDVSSNQYHNKKFADLAEAVGLEVQKHSSRGFAHTSEPDEFKAMVDTWGLNEEVFSMHRLPDPKRGKKGSKLKKWTCDCGYGIRIAVQPEKVDLTCGICGGRVLPAE